MHTVIRDVSALSEEMLRQAQVFREPDAVERVESAMGYVSEAADVIRRGGLVAFPTETVYGLGADAMNAASVRNIYAAKGRPSDNPMIVHIARASDVGLVARTITPAAVKLADAFWPGPLTMILEKHEQLPEVVTGGLDTVGVRMPDCPVASELIRAAGTPIAAPSANISGRPSPTKAEHVMADLTGRVDMILAGADSRIGIESTVVDMTTDTPLILRPGILSAWDISCALELPVGIDPSLSPEATTSDEEPLKAPKAPKAPGMKYRHYAPNAEMLVIEGENERVEAELKRLKALNERIGRRVGLISFGESEYLRAAHDFYARLRELDESGVDLIIAGALKDDGGVGFAVMNRMLKSAGYNIVRV